MTPVIDPDADTVVDETPPERVPIPSALPPPVDPRDRQLDDTFAQRYVVRSVLGAGGMGDVRLCRDQRIGRDVALKTMQHKLATDESSVERFLREARVQGQLEHPAIVPVHEIGVDPDGSVYFTMKRIRGSTLQSMLETSRFSLHKLLSAFVSVCLAVDFAHARGVVHRDLKPSNIMLGDFGEVYVLDWGIAKVESDTGVGQAPSPLDSNERLETAAGSLLGTPGYMSPEQLAGEPIDARSDIYSLGAILFEILTGQPLHVGSLPEILASTALGGDAHASKRSPHVAPELEAICVRACARAAADRFSSAREMADALEGYLQGDRDAERRREMAIEHVGRARGLLTTNATLEQRTDAMRVLGQALALDSTNTDALTTLVGALTEVPQETPDEVRKTIDQASNDTVRIGARNGTLLLVVWFLFVPLFYWMGMRDTQTLVTALSLVALAIGVGIVGLQRPVFGKVAQYTVFVLTVLAYVAFSRFFGPFVMAPTMFATYAISVQAHPHHAPRRFVLALTSIAFLFAVALEYSGLFARTTTFVGEGLLIHTNGSLHEAPAVAFFVFGSLAMLLAPCYFIGQIRNSLTRTERKMHLLTWHLARVVPADVTSSKN